MKRVALVTSGFAPYRVPLWNALGDIVPTSVFLLSSQEKIRSWKMEDSSIRVPVETITGNHIYVGALDWGLNVSYGAVQKKLSEVNPDAVIVTGYESPGFWAALNWARKHDRACIFHSGSTNLSTRTLGLGPTDYVKSFFIRRVDAYYTYGRYAAEFLVRLGADRSRIVVGQNLSDTSLTQSCERIDDLPIPSILYVGQLIPRKGVLEMVQALSRLTELPWQCSIVGVGPQQPEIESAIRKTGLEGRVSLLGWKKAAETAAIYRKHDILVMPSIREVWGLVTNEAMLSGLFVVGSNKAASCLELIQEGLNGVLIDPTVDGIRNGIASALSQPLPDRRRIRESVSHISPEGEAGKIWSAIQIAEQRHLAEPLRA